MPVPQRNHLPKKPQPQTRITMPAFKHMVRIVRAMKQQGRVVSYTSYMSDLILSQPMPTNGNGSHPVTVAERTLTQEKQ
jgi:hypothetical protein